MADNHLAIQDDRCHGDDHGKLDYGCGKRTAFPDIGSVAKEENKPRTP
jgi:hypothetical protein